MIKFFRHIRYKLMSENKTGKYFKYAIGEILLVVIGILIALQINTWNEGRKAEKLRIHLLLNLKVDMEQDLSRLSTINRFINERENYAKFLLNYFENPPKEIDSIEVVVALERSGFAHTLEPPMPTYTEMKGSGNLSLLKSETLKKSLASYNTFITTNSKIEARNENVFSNFSNAVLAYMDSDFGYIDINEKAPEAYRGINFDLEAMLKDNNIKLLLKNVHNKSIVEQRFKTDLVKPRIKRVLSLINEQLKDTLK